MEVNMEIKNIALVASFKDQGIDGFIEHIYPLIKLLDDRLEGCSQLAYQDEWTVEKLHEIADGMCPTMLLRICIAMGAAFPQYYDYINALGSLAAERYADKVRGFIDCNGYCTSYAGPEDVMEKK